MKVGLELFDLIKSLTQGENSVVRRNLSPKKDAIYDLFRKMTVFDHATVKAHFPGMTDANIATTEHQLIDTILKLLWNSAPRHGMRDLVLAIGKVEILTRKRLHSLALNKVEEAIRIALELDAMNELLRALRLKKEIMDVLRNAAPTDEEDVALSRWAAARIAESGSIEDLYVKVLSLRNAQPARKAQIISECQFTIGQLTEPILRKNQALLIWCKHLLAYISEDFETAFKNAGLMVDLMDRNEGLFADIQLRNEYFWALHFLVVFDTEQANISQAQSNLSKFERRATHLLGGIAADPNLNARFTHASLWLILCSKDWDAAKLRLKHTFRELTAPGSPLLFKHKPVWLRMTLLAAFVVQDYTMVRRLSFELRKAVSEAYLASAFVSSIAIFQLAAIYEEKDEFLAQAVQNARAWLKDMECLGPYEEAMLEFFEQAGRQIPDIAPASLLVKLKSKLETLFEDQLMWQHREMFPVLQWIKAHLQKIDLRDVMFP